MMFSRVLSPKMKTIDVISALMYFFMLSEGRRCIDGSPISEFEPFRSSLPGFDESGECYLINCREDQCAKWNGGNPTCFECPNTDCILSHALNVPGCKNCESEKVFEIHHAGSTMNHYFTNGISHCSQFKNAIAKNKTVIKRPRNSYCTKSQICGFEPIKIHTEDFKTRKSILCHDIPLAIAMQTDKYSVHGNTFHETIQCSFDICDLSHYLELNYWTNHCYTNLELALSSVIIFVFVLMMGINIVKCIRKFIYCRILTWDTDHLSQGVVESKSACRTMNSKEEEHTSIAMETEQEHKKSIKTINVCQSDFPTMQ